MTEPRFGIRLAMELDRLNILVIGRLALCFDYQALAISELVRVPEFLAV